MNKYIDKFTKINTRMNKYVHEQINNISTKYVNEYMNY